MPLTLIILVSLVLLGSPYLTIGLSERRLQTHALGNTVALQVAEAGVERVIWEYNHNDAAFTGACDAATGAQWASVATGAQCANGAPCPAGTCQQCTYTLTSPVADSVGNNTLGSAAICVQNAAGADSTAVVTGTAQGSGVQTQVIVALHRATSTTSPIKGGLVVQQDPVNWVGDITIDNYDSNNDGFTPSLIDGYSSADGVYGPGNSLQPAALTAIGSMPVYMTGAGVTSYGDIYAYNTGNPPSVTVSSGAAWLNGAAVNSGSHPPLPPVQMPAVCSNPVMPATCEQFDAGEGNYLYVRVTRACELPAGTYCFPGGLHVEGTLTTAGKVEIYAGFNVFVGSHVTRPPAQVIPYDNKPSNLRVYSTIQSLSFRPFMFSHADKIMGIFYHDVSRQTSGGSWIDEGVDFYGSMVDSRIRVSASNVHYDRQIAVLADLPEWLLQGAPHGPVTVTSWKRQQVP